MLSILPRTGESAYTAFDIKLDSDQVILRGDAHEAEDVILRGSVVFSNPFPIKVFSVNVVFRGEYTATYAFIRAVKEATDTFDSGPIPRTLMYQRGTFRRDETALYSARTAESSSLKPGNHVWPFEFLIKGCELESLRGLRHNAYKYKVQVVVERPRLVGNHKLYKEINVIRTYDPTSIALHQSVSADAEWKDRIHYTISTPSKAVVFGSIIPVDLTLIPLSKGLKIAEVTITLMEQWTWQFTRTPDYPNPGEPSTIIRPIVSDVYAFPDDAETEEINGLEGYRFSRQVQAPRNLQGCRLSLNPVLPHDVQTLNYPLIKIKHYLEVAIVFKNPDGHASEVKARLPVVIFLTANQRFDEEHRLLNSGGIPMTNNADIIASEFAAPPTYGDHTGDETLDAHDWPSGMTSPAGQLSRRASATNLQEPHDDQRRFADAIRNILSDLRGPDFPPGLTMDTFTSEPATPSRRESSRDLGVHNAHGSSASLFANGRSLAAGSPSRTLSGVQTPALLDFDAEALSRVPSYHTASQQSIPLAESYAGLPTYNEVSHHSQPELPVISSGVTST